MTTEEHKRLATVCYALGWTRGQLDRVLDGTADLKRIREVSTASALAQIAEAVGMTEANFPTGWHAYISDAEKWTLSGRNRALR